MAHAPLAPIGDEIGLGSSATESGWAPIGRQPCGIYDRWAAFASVA